jgi:hypothetical protein
LTVPTSPGCAAATEVTPFLSKSVVFAPVLSVRPMRQKVAAPNGLHWVVKRLIVPTGMRPLTGTEMLDAATPRRTVVDGMSRQVPDASNAPTGPVPLGFLLFPLVLPLVPVALLLRRLRLLPWIEARTYPWGRRYPPIVLEYLVRGGPETRRAFDQRARARRGCPRHRRRREDGSAAPAA